MHLLNANTLQLEEFTDDERPKYAILSHRWQSEEVTFRDIQEDTGNRKKGFTKLRMACKQTLYDNLTHIWIDTCCIDKSSSAELSEAINAMYRWYAGADRCYVFLFDVSSPEPGMGNQVWETELENSSWFTRSWTLQELIAPKVMIFYDRNWKEYGEREQLQQTITNITGISYNVYDTELDSFPIITRMQWAAARSATRKEDIAYSLMGLFDVNMPMLYGEGGSKAFIRLQQELIKTTTDRTILLWNSRDTENHKHYNIMAGSPKDFDLAISQRHYRYLYRSNLEPFTLTSAGLEMPVHLIRQGINEYVALLAGPRIRDENYVLVLRPVLLTKTRLVFARICARSMSKNQLERSGLPYEARITIQSQLKQKVPRSFNGIVVNAPSDGTDLGTAGYIQSVEIEGQRGSSNWHWIHPEDCREWVCSIRISVMSANPPHQNVNLRFKLGFDFWSRPICLVWVHDSQHDGLDKILETISLTDVLGAGSTAMEIANADESRYAGTSGPYHVYRIVNPYQKFMERATRFNIGFSWDLITVSIFQNRWNFELLVPFP